MYSNIFYTRYMALREDCQFEGGEVFNVSRSCWSLISIGCWSVLIKNCEENRERRYEQRRRWYRRRSSRLSHPLGRSIHQGSDHSESFSLFIYFTILSIWSFRLRLRLMPRRDRFEFREFDLVTDDDIKRLLFMEYRIQCILYFRQYSSSKSPRSTHDHSK